MKENVIFKLRLLIATVMMRCGFACARRRVLRLMTLVLAMLLGSSAYATDEYLLVSNREGRNILRYDADTGAFIDVLVPAGAGGMNVPYGMTLGPDGNLYVASQHTEIYPTVDHRVLKFDSHTGEYLGAFASDPAMIPSNQAFGPDGNLYVTDPNANGMVFRFDGKTGASMGVFATGDPGDSYYDLAWGPDGNLYVGTLSNHIDRFDGATGASLGTLPTPQTGSTNSTTFGPDGLLYVSDYFGGHVDAYNIFTGDLVKSFYGLSGAHGLAFTNAGDILVSSYFSNEILKFENGSSTGIEFTAGHPIHGPLDLVALPVPEPSTHAMLLAGLGLLGFTAFRRKQNI
ncbi:MAG TPA: NHL repeat-containing protein [Nitrosomonas sp.]|jgi:sugar lactone lactonase YvrE|nr:NHL repeat-containing protein [Nitrosomonas sp.]HRB96954.1 NHL repeat-containing protein [Nitrosomonas sp.]